MMRPALIIIALAVCFAPLSGRAQGIPSLDDSFVLSVSPTYPQPYSTAKISFSSSGFNLAGGVLSVSQDGKKIYTGNASPIVVTLGKAGSITTIDASITVQGKAYASSVSIQPEDVSVVAEPISSAPPLYPGKPLVPLEGGTRVAAVANLRDAKGKQLAPAALSYVWTIDDTRIDGSSGIGRSSIVVASPLEYRLRTVSVVVTDQSGSVVGGADLSLMPVEPTVQIYDNDPLLGIRFDHALTGTYAISGSEDSLYAAPYSLATTAGTPTINWFLNGTGAQTGPTITLRPSGSGQGTATLSLTASAGDTTATTNLPITFGKQSDSSFFSL